MITFKNGWESYYSKCQYLKRSIFLLTFIIFLGLSFWGQCPDRDSLRKRIIYLRDTFKLFPQKQLPELLAYLSKIGECPYRNDSTHIFLLRKIADAYFQEAEYLKAAQYRRQAIDILTANANRPSVNRKILPGIYYYLSVAYDSLKNFAAKMDALDSCSTIAMRLNYVDRACLTALVTEVENFYDVGDYQRCIDYAERCRMLAYEYGENNTGPEKAIAALYASNSLGWQIKALLNLDKFEQAEDLLKDKIGEYKKAGLKDYLGLTYGQLAEAERQRNNFESALFYFNQSFRYYQEIRDSFNCKQTLKDIGYSIYFKHFNDGDKALAYYKKALRYATKDPYWIEADIAESLNIFANIANLFVQKRQYDSSDHYFRLAFNQIKPGISEEAILQSSPEEFREYKAVHYIASLFIDKGDAFKQQYHANRQKSSISNAIQTYRAADQLLDRIKVEQIDLESKLFWRNDSRRLYENAIDACYSGDDIDGAFYFFEKSRAVLLSDQLNEQRWLGEIDIMKQTQLKKKILREKRELESITSSGKAKELKRDIFEDNQELDRLIKAIQSNSPLYFQNFLDKNFISVKDVQQKVLKDHQALVELFAGDSAVYVLVITNNKSYLQKIDKTNFEHLSDVYRDYISSKDLLNRNFDSFKNLSLQLYHLLFQNISLPAGRIIISPDGRYFPFEALVTNTEPLTYFLEDHAVSYTYSARYLLNDFPTNSAMTSSAFMGVAPVQYSNGLPALLGSDQSLKKLKNYFNSANNFIRDQASKNNFLKEYYKYKIIQLYTHATDSGFTGEPMIYFSDSILSMSDLFYENKPATTLIVLSACETAEGKLYNGEGVFSFNRQFAALGIPSSISNLWQVDNRSSYRLTELFYKYLAKGFSLDIALQNAKKEFRKTASSKEQDLPYYWAAPILAGQTNEILLPKTFAWKWIVIVSTLLLLCFWFSQWLGRNRLRFRA